MYLFDTHTHVNHPAFSAEGGSASGGKDDREQTIKRALDAQTWMINVGTGADTSKSAVDLAKKYEQGVFAAIGLHPSDAVEGFNVEQYEAMLSDKVVAVGECGLDYFRLPETGQEAVISKQKTEFIKQLHFAKKHRFPVIIHCRDAYADILEILKYEYKDGMGVIHSFTDTYDTAKKFLDLGFYVALNGILTFDKTGKLAEVVEKSPLDRLLTETDAPYLTPPPFRGKRNEPSYVQYVAAKIAEIKKISLAEAGKQTFKNACEFFQIKNPQG